MSSLKPITKMDDPFTDTGACVRRLYAQYKRTPRLVVACDFDETLFDFHKAGFTFPRAINLLKRCNALGFYVVIFTASNDGRFPFIEWYMRMIGVKIDAINENVLEESFKYGKSRKIFYNIFLDDRCGLGQAIDILDQTLTKIETKEFYNEALKTSC